MSRKVLIRFIPVLGSLLLVLASRSSPCFAEARPDVTFYGTVYVNDQAMTATNTDCTVTVAVDGVELARYTLGSETRYGNHYVLKVPMDDNPKRPKKAQAGDIAHVYVLSLIHI